MPDSSGATNRWDVVRDIVARVLDWRFLVFVGAVLVGMGMLDAGPLAVIIDKAIAVIKAAR